ncbi:MULTISPECIES: outer membrane beta-barrel protein [unclassified Lysobacter]|uniref:outer membrane beta-barrel protein n=1 Tax=unclassified Lysobacter TaxID=2635362 RepID=UPI001C21C4FB|nr:outer membrane beta-barrel protein [Lysobacter sp. MMG2]MBU8974926.1 outer membrane beta-barrel protein [Lysobacter sp. MMG2]
MATLPMGAKAAQINYSIGGRVEHSDNIALTETNPQEESTLATDLDFDLTQTGRNTALTARGGLEYLYYTGDLFDDDLRATMVGTFNWNTWQDRLKFIIEDYANYEPIDVLAADAPNNQQQVNVFVAGAQFNLRPGAATRVRLDLRYNNYWAEETDDFNGDRYNAAFTLWQEPSATTRFAVTVEGSEVKYDQVSLDTLGADYRRLDTYVTWNRNLANINVEVRAGYSWIELTDFGTKDDAPLFRTVFTWRATPRSTLDMGLYYQFSDAAQELMINSGDPTLGGTPLTPVDTPSADPTGVTIGPDLYRQRRIDIGYRYNGERFNASVRPYYEDNDYIDPTADSEGNYGIGVGMSWAIQPSLFLTGSMSAGVRSFDSFDRDDDDFSVYVGILKVLTRHWSFAFDLRHQERDSNTPEASYDENAAIFSVRYTR